MTDDNSGSAATASSMATMPSQGSSLAQRVMSCPWITRSSMRTKEILICGSLKIVCLCSICRFRLYQRRQSKFDKLPGSLMNIASHHHLIGLQQHREVDSSHHGDRRLRIWVK